MGPHLFPDPLSVPWTELCLRSSAGALAAPHLYHHLKGTRPGTVFLSSGDPPLCLPAPLPPHLPHHQPCCCRAREQRVNPWLGNSQDLPGDKGQGTWRVGTLGTFTRSPRLCHYMSPSGREGANHGGPPWPAEPPPLTCTTAPRPSGVRGAVPLRRNARATGVFLLLISRLFSLDPSSPSRPPPPRLLASGLSPLISPSPRNGGHGDPRRGQGS